MSTNHPLHNHTFETSFGKILAFKENGVIKAKSIRYAQSERFKKPIPLESAENFISDKTPVCPQKISPLLERLIGKTDIEKFQPEESTQFLTITRPENLVEENLPVIVWIHGGSYEIGCGDLPTSDPSVWVKEQNIIVVSVSYRLGLFGFLGGNDERPANLGLFDIIEALKWIKKYINDFGGNPENITLFGQSSGGDAIAHLLISEGVDNLFKRVIIQSAPLGFRLKREKMYTELFSQTDFLKDDTDVLKMVDSYQNFLPSSFKYGLKAAMPFCLKYGHEPLPQENETLKKWKDNASKIDVLIGFNEDETSFYVKTAQEGLYTYLHNSVLNRIVKITTKSIYGKPAEIFAENYASGGGNIHLYKIKLTLKKHFIGASHCFDLPLIFANKDAWKDAKLLKDVPWEYIFENGKKLRAVWAEFARNGKILQADERPDILEIRKI
ncbi:carboxylesterase family protein [Chryseobacterium caseinilyticum]|uniref:Carboxylic ester hydrolase n=1 Tax=Chryseobacterium caseinilyticum TaxID=2771428 RepID=A0ABR8ZGV2_9FLAO|nr:carboxylesterase family protein [Chryseobacterium caseinilyticum]MBD8083906.1 carboxylesterase/lipase family protein [Chryseobacterium caseinilyticum]